MLEGDALLVRGMRRLDVLKATFAWKSAADKRYFATCHAKRPAKCATA